MTKIGDADVRIECRTNYPFSGNLVYTITSAASFEFFVRTPAWAMRNNSSTYRIKGGKPRSVSPNSDGLQAFRISKGQTTIEVDLSMSVEVAQPRNGSVAIYYGPLLYAVDIDFGNATYHSPLNWTDLEPLPSDQITAQTKDWVLNPTSEWRYAIDPSSVTVEKLFNQARDLANPIWTSSATPAALWVDAWLIDWPETLGTAALPPINPIVSGEPKKVRLIPYGAAKLHIADFPVAVRAVNSTSATNSTAKSAS